MARARKVASVPVSLVDLLRVSRDYIATSESKPLSTIEALRAKYGADFVGFCPLLKVPHVVTGEPIPLDLTPIQLELNATRTGRDFWLKSRQVYVTTMELGRDIWFWLMRPGATVRIICPTHKEKWHFRDLSRRIEIMLQSLVDAGLQLSTQAQATGRWVLPTWLGGGALELLEAGAAKHTAGNVGRGGTCQRLHCTETAKWHLAATTMRAAEKSVHRGGGTEIVHEGTPEGMSVKDATGHESGDAFDAAGGPWFHSQWKKAVAGQTEFKPHFVPWFKHPEYRLALAANDGTPERIAPEDQPLADRRLREMQLVAAGVDQEQLKWYRAEVAKAGQYTTDQEYPSDPDSCFLVSGRSFFDRDRTLDLLAKARKVEPVETHRIVRPGASGELRLFKLPDPTHRYLIAGDTSGGEGGDPAALVIYDWTALGEHVATLHGQFRPAELARIAVALGIRYRTEHRREVRWGQVAVERNNHGSAVLQKLEDDGVVDDVVGRGAVRDLRKIAGLPLDNPVTTDTRSFLARLQAWAKPKAGLPPCYPEIWSDLDGKHGWWTGGPSRSDGLSLLEQDHREGRWSSPDAALLDEMRVFVVSDGRAAAASGKTDDLVFAAMIGWAIMGRAPIPGPSYGLGNLPPA